MAGLLTFWTIYERPKDYPTEFVGRRHCVGLPGLSVDAELFARGPRLDDVRAEVPPDAIRVGPHPSDDPMIAEVWMS